MKEKKKSKEEEIDIAQRGTNFDTVVKDGQRGMILLIQFDGSQKGTGERRVRDLQRRGDNERSQLKKGEGEEGCGSQGDPLVSK